MLLEPDVHGLLPRRGRPPRVAGKCDKCGSPLILRDDDKEETVRRRLKEFHKNTRA